MNVESAHRKGVARRLAVAATVSLLLLWSAPAGVHLAVTGATPGATTPGAGDTAAGQAEDATEVGSCTTITEPGEYVLVSDVENASETCIEIEADDVTFDGAGHVIDGSERRFARHTGIRVTDAEDVVVRDVTLTDWGFAGLYLRGVADARVRNVTATDSEFGITVRSSRAVRVEASTATNHSDAGIDLSTTRDSVVADSVVADNQADISLTTASVRNRVVRNAIRDNELGVVLSNADNNVVSDNVLCGNREAFLRPERPKGNTFEDNRAC